MLAVLFLFILFSILLFKISGVILLDMLSYISENYAEIQIHFCGLERSVGGWSSSLTSGVNLTMWISFKLGSCHCRLAYIEFVNLLLYPLILEIMQKQGISRGDSEKVLLYLHTLRHFSLSPLDVCLLPVMHEYCYITLALQ